MDHFKSTLLLIEEGKYNMRQLVSILVLVVSKLNINTISETARIEGKTPRGIRISNNYLKIKIGKKLFAIIGVKCDSLPF